MPDTDRLTSRQLSDEDVLQLMRDCQHADHLLAEHVQALMRHHFQQAINCCQTTAVAYALSALGFPTTPDDIFWTVAVDVDTAVNAGMTLAETHELALRYIHKLRLPVFVEAYCFDDHAGIGVDDFWQACLDDVEGGANDVLALNFHSGIAHGWDHGGGGHFALLVSTLPETRELIVSDVHALKYGAHWSVPVARMHAAIRDKDTSIGRARGVLRFGRHGTGLKRPIAALAQANRIVDWIAPPAPYLGAYLQRYVPRQWFSSMGARNMEGVSAVALACRVLEEPSPQVASLDRIMRTLRASYTAQLNRFCSAQELHEMLLRLARKKHIRAVPSLQPLGARLDACALRSALVQAGCGKATVAVLVPFDAGVACNADLRGAESAEANVLSHGSKSWGLLAAVDPQAADDAPTGVVVAAAHAVTFHGRLWTCSIEAMARAIAAVGAEHLLLLSSDALIDRHAKLDALLHILERHHMDRLAAQDLADALTAEGFPVSVAQAEELVREASNAGADTLDHTEAVEMLLKAAGTHPGQAAPGQPRYEAVARFMAAHGCVTNDLGFSTVHLALQAADLQACARFYNHVVGWPLYKTVDRGHAEHGAADHGSSWASFGAFASFIVFHQEDVPVGQRGHGPWADAAAVPPGLRGVAGSPQSLAFGELPFPFLGVVLEPGFFARQMQRIADKDPAVRWLQVDGVQPMFGGAEIASAVVLRDPDGYPLVFFVSARAGDDYARRFPCTPFVYGTEIKAAYPSAQDEAAKQVADDAWIASCPTIAKYRSSEATRPWVSRWLATHAYGRNSLAQHKAYYEDVLGCHRLAEVDEVQAQRIQLEYEWDRHFMVLRTNRRHDGALLAAATTDHDMGGNKGRVPVPHFGVNTSHEAFSACRQRVTEAMKRHGVPYDMCVSLSAMGHAPAYNALDSYHLLFPTDPDSCLSMLCCDPGGNMNEIKFYLDFGEMFHGSGSIGIDGLTIDNSMVEQHFPAAVLRMLRNRGLRGEADGLEVLRREQQDLVDGGVVDD